MLSPSVAKPGVAIALLLGTLVVVPLPAEGQSLFSIARDDNQLRVINPVDGATIGTPVSITLPAKTVEAGNGLATHPQTGDLYALVRVSTGFPPDRWLVTIDRATGNATEVGNTGARFAGLAFDSSGTLYAVTGNGEVTLIPRTLYTLSLIDATSTFVKTFGIGDVPGETIAFNPDDGFLYHAYGVDDGLNPDTRTFEKLNLNTLAVTNIPISGDGYSEMTALVFSGNSFFGADTEIGIEGEVFLSMTDGGAVSVIGSMDHVAKGLAFGPPLQLPSLDDRGLALLGITLLALGMATLGGHLRKRPGRGQGFT